MTSQKRFLISCHGGRKVDTCLSTALAAQGTDDTPAASPAFAKTVLRADLAFSSLTASLPLRKAPLPSRRAA